MKNVINAKNLYKCYPGFPPVLRGINIDVKAGEMVAIMGPSGCGKSTMLHILGMLHLPDSGELNILDTDVQNLDRDQIAAFRRGNMGFVMQSSNLFEHSTVFENVEFPLIYEQVPPEERWERVIRALELVRLSHRVSYRSNRLSGGEQQRVAIARAMVNNPRILLADEPTGALDARTSKVVMQNFKSLAHDGGIAMVIVTHDPTVAEYCDSIYTLEDGVLVCQRQDPIPASGGDSQILATIPRKLNLACVVDEFPTPYGIADTQSILNLYDQRILSRVYSMRGTSLTAIGEGEYSLPVPIKKQGAIRTLWNIISLLRINHGNPSIVWKYWSEIPSKQKINVFKVLRIFWDTAKSVATVRWSLHDESVHLHGIGSADASTTAWMAAGILGIPFSFSINSQELNNVSFLAVKAKYAALICCDTKKTREIVKQACLAQNANFPTEKLLQVYNTPALNPATDDLSTTFEGSVHGAINILIAGHITAKKGIITVLKACLALKKENVPIHLTIAGEGRGLGLLRLRARLMGLRKFVTFKKYVPNEQMFELFRNTNIFISPNENTYSGVPLGLMEAMLFALPVVASDIDAHLEVLQHEKSALIFEKNNFESLKEALNRAIIFPDESRILGDAAQKIAQELFSQEQQGIQMSKAILQCHELQKT